MSLTFLSPRRELVRWAGARLDVDGSVLNVTQQIMTTLDVQSPGWSEHHCTDWWWYKEMYSWLVSCPMISSWQDVTSECSAHQSSATRWSWQYWHDMRKFYQSNICIYIRLVWYITLFTWGKHLVAITTLPNVGLLLVIHAWLMGFISDFTRFNVMTPETLRRWWTSVCTQDIGQGHMMTCKTALTHW